MPFTNKYTNENGELTSSFSMGRLFGGVIYAAVGAVVGVGTSKL